MQFIRKEFSLKGKWHWLKCLLLFFFIILRFSHFHIFITIDYRRMHLRRIWCRCHPEFVWWHFSNCPPIEFYWFYYRSIIIGKTTSRFALHIFQWKFREKRPPFSVNRPLTTIHSSSSVVFPDVTRFPTLWENFQNHFSLFFYHNFCAVVVVIFFFQLLHLVTTLLENSSQMSGRGGKSLPNPLITNRMIKRFPEFSIGKSLYSRW